MKRLLASLACGMGAALAMLPQARADDYPSHPVTLINPYAPGGPADTLARTLAQELKNRLGQTVIVENKPGAAATIGTGYVARAKPDGYTLLMATSPGNVVGPMIEHVPFDGIADFTFIGMVGDQPIALLANPGLGVSNLQQLIELARKEPGALHFASAGTGGPTHLAGELLRRRARIDIGHVPYRGAAPALQDLIGGQVQLGMITLSSALPFIKDGKVKAIAYTGARRSALAPDIPTMKEAGIKDWSEVSTWYILAAPRGTPQPIVDKLARALAQINAEPAHQRFLAEQDAAVQEMTPAQVAQFVQRDKATMSELISALGLAAK